jgi:hypothetical protein
MGILATFRLERRRPMTTARGVPWCTRRCSSRSAAPGIMSSSRNRMTSARARATPRSRAAPAPWFTVRSSTRWNGCCVAWSAGRGSTREPSSTTITSNCEGGRVCASRLATRAATRSGRSYVGMTTLSRGRRASAALSLGLMIRPSYRRTITVPSTRARPTSTSTCSASAMGLSPNEIHRTRASRARASASPAGLASSRGSATSVRSPLSW